MANERNRDDEKRQSPPNERSRDAAKKATRTDTDAARSAEPNHLGEAERAFEETDGGREPRDS